MEVSKKDADKPDGKFEEYVSVLQVSENDCGKDESSRKDGKFRQIFLTFCASLLAVPFGFMLGWTSPNYPYLIQPTAEIPISMSQSAMIAGFFMLGVTVATPISSKYTLGPKYGILTGLILIIVGWLLMCYSQNIFWFLGSRFTVGFGGGYGTGQVKIYIKEICDSDLALFSTKLLNFYFYFGLVSGYSIGAFFEFRTFPFIPVITSFAVFFVSIFLPTTPKDLIREKKIDKAARMLDTLRGKKNHSAEIERLQVELEAKNEGFFIPIMKNGKLRKKFFIFVSLIFFQQFSGVPSTIIYCNVILVSSGCPNAEYCAILYAILYFTFNLYGTFFSPKLNKKSVMILSSSISSLMLAFQIVTLYYDVNSRLSPYFSFVILLLFMASYLMGVGNLPVTYIVEWFPKEYSLGMNKVAIMGFSMFALLATKLFQILITAFPLYAGFCMFLSCDLIFLILVTIFVKSKPKNLDGYVKSNVMYFWNVNNNRKKKINVEV